MSRHYRECIESFDAFTTEVLILELERARALASPGADKRHRSRLRMLLEDTAAQVVLESERQQMLETLRPGPLEPPPPPAQPTWRPPSQARSRGDRRARIPLRCEGYRLALGEPFTAAHVEERIADLVCPP